jgi:hypothetical protein
VRMGCVKEAGLPGLRFVLSITPDGAPVLRPAGLRKILKRPFDSTGELAFPGRRWDAEQGPSGHRL